MQTLRNNPTVFNATSKQIKISNALAIAIHEASYSEYVELSIAYRASHRTFLMLDGPELRQVILRICDSGMNITSQKAGVTIYQR